MRVVRPLALELVEGPGRAINRGPHTLPVRIGSAAGNEIVLDDPAVSRYHCTIEETPDGVVVRDTGSTNGVWLGGQRVLIGLIDEGSQLRLGQTVLQLGFGEGRPEPASVPTLEAFQRLTGRSPAMQRCLRTLEKVAPTKMAVLIEGETGTGKELVARALHDASVGADRPFVAVDFGSTADAVVESVLFGHEPGAFAGADSARVGAFVAANGGTLFLDGVGELPLDLQPKLLRALETQTVTPLGSVGSVPFEVRVVAATHRNLRRMANEGTFREDLYFRLSVCPMRLPSLKERREDIPAIARSIFLEAIELLEETPAVLPELEPAAISWLQRQPWPGNIRELRNVMQRAVILARLEDVQAGRIAEALDRAAHGHFSASEAPTGLEAAKRNFERAYLLELLHRHRGRRAAAAEEAQIHIKSLQRLVRRHGLKGEIP